MKRTPLKRGNKQMKRGTLNKKSPQKISVVQRKLWELCKQITRKKYGNSCYTCPRTGLVGSDWQTGHMWAKASLGAQMKYDLRVLRPQCAICNLWHGGMGAEFYKRMLKEEGKTYMKNLELDKQRLLLKEKAIDYYLSLIPRYEKILAELP